MGSIFVWIESTPLSVWIRESSSVFGFPTILSLHTVGMGMVAGLSAAVDLRILGLAPRVPLMELKRFLPFIWFGFWLNAASGVGLLIGFPTKALTNPVFYAKLLFIALGVVTIKLIQNRVFGDPNLDYDPVQRKGRMLAVASLLCWAGAIATGRFLAYTYTKLLSI
jgi:hypothetical protein